MRYKPILTFVIIVITVFTVYFGTATQWTFRPPWTIDYVNPMAQALREGRLDISNPAMTYDLAFYNGRWYMTWGALAAIVHVPLQLVAGGRYVPALYTSLLFGSLTVGVVWQMLRQIRKDWFPREPAWQNVAFAFFYAFGTMQFYLSTVGSIWQVNQVVSMFFGALGVAVIFRKKRSIDHCITSFLCFGIALFGRPTVALLGIIPAVLFLDTIWRRPLIVLPFFLAIVVLLVYNTARFGSPFETGHRFLTEAPELAAKREQYGMLSLQYVPTNAWHMIAAPPKIRWEKGLRFDIDLMGNSIFLLSPLLLFAFGTLPLIRKQPVIAAVWMGIVVTGAASLLYYNTGWMQFGYRYALDFSFLLIILAFFWFNGRLRWWVVPLYLYTLWVNYTGIRLLQ